MRWMIITILLLVPFSAHAGVLEESLESFRLSHYEGYPASFTGKVYRPDGTTTSETLGYAAMLECSDGDIELCKAILFWAETHAWKGGQTTFAWWLSRNDLPVKGTDSATDGDLELLWSLLKGIERTNDQRLLALYQKWSPGIRRYDTCHYGNLTIIASGSGIGRWNGCNSFNGVYAAYIMPPLLFDLAVFDPETWKEPFLGSLKESYDLGTMEGNMFPNRCVAYNGVQLNSSLCEINPPYMDYLDAQRWVFWTGSICKREAEVAQRFGELPQLKLLCNHIRELTKIIPADFSTGSAGYHLEGRVRGRRQYSDFSGALWLPAISYTRIDAPMLEQKVLAGVEKKLDARLPMDDFKDPLMMLSLKEAEGRLWTLPNGTFPVEHPEELPEVKNQSSSSPQNQTLEAPLSGSENNFETYLVLALFGLGFIFLMKAILKF